MENIHTLVFQVKSEEGKGAVDKLRAELDTGRFLFMTYLVVGATLQDIMSVCLIRNAVPKVTSGYAPQRPLGAPKESCLEQEMNMNIHFHFKLNLKIGGGGDLFWEVGTWW